MRMPTKVEIRFVFTELRLEKQVIIRDLELLGFSIVEEAVNEVYHRLQGSIARK